MQEPYGDDVERLTRDEHLPPRKRSQRLSDVARLVLSFLPLAFFSWAPCKEYGAVTQSGGHATWCLLIGTSTTTSAQHLTSLSVNYFSRKMISIMD